MRLVLDTNVLVSAVLRAGTPRTLLRRVLDGRATLLESQETFEELVRVLQRPTMRLSYAEVERALHDVANTALWIQVDSRVSAVPEDPDDEAFLALAVDGRADLLVSGDRHLLDLKEFDGIPIVPAADALSMLDLGGNL